MDGLLKDIRQTSVKICGVENEDINKLIESELQLKNDFIFCLKQISEEQKTKVKSVSLAFTVKVKQKRNELKSEYNAKVLQAFEEQKLKEKRFEESAIAVSESTCCSAIAEFEKYLKSAYLAQCDGQTTSRSSTQAAFTETESFTIKEDIKERIRKELVDNVYEVVERMRRNDKGIAESVYEKNSAERNERNKDFNRKLLQHLDSFESTQRMKRVHTQTEQKHQQLRDECTQAVKQCFERLKKRRAELQTKVFKGENDSSTKITSVKGKYGELKQTFQRSLIESGKKGRPEYDEELKTAQDLYLKKIHALFLPIVDKRTKKATEVAEPKSSESDDYVRDIFDAFKKKENEDEDRREVKRQEMNIKYRAAFVTEARNQIKNLATTGDKAKKGNAHKKSSSAKHTKSKRKQKHRKDRK